MIPSLSNVLENFSLYIQSFHLYAIIILALLQTQFCVMISVYVIATDGM
jgi:hypothetical protein